MGEGADMPKSMPVVSPPGGQVGVVGGTSQLVGLTGMGGAGELQGYNGHNGGVSQW